VEAEAYLKRWWRREEGGEVAVTGVLGVLEFPYSLCLSLSLSLSWFLFRFLFCAFVITKNT
jgi:hypothetical protein